MKNIDYVLEKYNRAGLEGEEFIRRLCPCHFDRNLKELDCDFAKCEDCWNLEVEDRI